MDSWTDPFTGVIYRMSDKWKDGVRGHLTELLYQKLKPALNAWEAADKCANFWWDYYGLVFPLRFGKSGTSDQQLCGEAVFDNQLQIDLGAYVDPKLRSRFLDEKKLPPLLPARTNPAKELIADRHLSRAALINVALRAKGEDKSSNFHSIRLGVLLHELGDVEPIASWLKQFDRDAWQIARALCGEEVMQDSMNANLIQAIYNGEAAGEADLCLVAVGVQRIKQYVFESAGLNEIRGASTMLDDCVIELKNHIGENLGPEVILRAAASTLEFLAPGAQASYWKDFLRKYFLSRTGTAFVAVAAESVTPVQIFKQFKEVRLRLNESLERDRYSPQPPITDALPFELRCNLCRSRPAEDWYKTSDGDFAPTCQVCQNKRELGKDEHKGKIGDFLDWLNLNDDLSPLGVNSSGFIAQDLGELAPENVRRKRVAVIYGDGNNFGAVAVGLDSLGLGLQWTHRVEKTTRAAVALALARATREAAGTKKLSKLPFQILALGGDDLSLFTWGRIGLRFCEHFLEMTDLEFQIGNGERIADPLSFSLGALFCDEKAPVRRTVAFAENELLKWAKRAMRGGSNIRPNRDSHRGNLAYLLALTAEQIPSELTAYRERMFLPSKGKKLCMTLRPFNSTELSFLLDKVKGLTDEHRGQLQRLVAPFVQSPPRVAILHYYYQKAREGKQRTGFFRKLEGESQTGLPEEWIKAFGSFPTIPTNLFPEGELTRRPFGEDPDEITRQVTLLSPLWDLLEIVKILE